MELILTEKPERVIILEKSWQVFRLPESMISMEKKQTLFKLLSKV